jgi:hypothetical protein
MRDLLVEKKGKPLVNCVILEKNIRKRREKEKCYFVFYYFFTSFYANVALSIHHLIFIFLRNATLYFLVFLLLFSTDVDHWIIYLFYFYFFIRLT